MTIDISNLDPEKKAFLKANPELLKSLEQTIPSQVSAMPKHEEKMVKTKAKWQRDLDETLARAEELRREYDPQLREIQDKFLRKLDVVKGDNALVCPNCGDSDKGNKMNGKSWCFKCKVPLVPKSQVAKWLKFPKVSHGNLKDEINRLISEEDK